MTILNNSTHIDHLIAAREAITNRTEDYINLKAVDAIDALLSDVPPGQRDDVDLLLGRTCAELPERAEYDTLAEWHDHREDYGPASHAATVAARMEVVAPDVDMNDMRDMTGSWTMPQAVEMRSWLHLLNDDNGMMGDRS